MKAAVCLSSPLGHFWTHLAQVVHQRRQLQLRDRGSVHALWRHAMNVVQGRREGVEAVAGSPVTV